jgi:hypothetical protein
MQVVFNSAKNMQGVGGDCQTKNLDYGRRNLTLFAILQGDSSMSGVTSSSLSNNLYRQVNTIRTLTF